MKEYDKSFFQLDRDLNLPLIAKKALPFFDRYSPQYDLIIIFSKYINPYTTDDKIIDKISKEGFDIEFGARNVRRYIQEHIENEISKMILANTVKKGDKKVLTVNQENQIIIV